MLLAMAGVSDAQTVTNPRIVEFDPSADHSAVLGGGQAAVSRYEMEVYLQGASAPFHLVDLGKPTPEGDGKIRHDFWSGVSAWPLPGGLYEVRVSAIGPNGSGRSDPSNAFSIDLCSYTLAETTKNVASTASSTSVAITAPSGCAWTASTSTAWISLTTASGSGNGSVAFSVSLNSSGNSRTGTIQVAGQTLTVVQAGATCTYTLSSTSQSVVATAGSASFSVTAPVGCAWSAASSQSWLTVSNPTGTGTSTVNYSFTANQTGSPRSATVTIAGQTVTITQATNCTYTLATPTHSVGSTAGSNTVALTVTAGCLWTATPSVGWITMTTEAGIGNATLAYTYQENPSSSPRTGTITVGGQTLTVSQAGTPVPPERPRNIRVITGAS